MLVIVDSGTGQMCNQLLFCAQVAASAYERKFRVRYYSFPKYKGIAFQDDCIDSFITKQNKKYRLYNIIKYFTKLIKLMGKNGFLHCLSIESKEDSLKFLKILFEKDAFAKKTYYWFGWPYMDYGAIQKNAELLQHYFRFTKDIKDKAANLLKRENGEFLCGIHIRRGDYKYWQGGKYYYENWVYIKYAREITKAYQGVRVRFILFSNEEVEEVNWRAARLQYSVSKEDAVTELCMMSLCDLLAGPPSTFSAWASFVGNTKRYVIDHADQVYNKTQCYTALLQTDGMGKRLL